ncbi:uncharacterized protein LOC126855343 isoform X2 [Cataglyphis hispanica]|uniref:uncharacterized protein LOC126855343 isoform X2 n=1 Tax=Cataglyphis hispanica TaxID=1086592 RepID=UPI00217FDD06|nr:uncharacterized protein LOC126855343 isoform X2 [Cataglyphis hispanica]
MRISGMPSEISGEYRFANFVLRDRRRSSSRILDLPLEHHGRLDKLYKFSIYFLVRHKASRKTQQDSDMSYRFLSAEIARISGVPSEISGEYRLASEWTCVCVCMCVSTKDGKDQITTISAVERKMVWTTNFRQTRDLIYLARSNARKAQILCEEKVATRETKMSVVSIVAWLLGAVALAAINNEVHCHNMPQSGNGKNGDTFNQNALEETVRSTGPYFDKSVSTNVTALLGKTTYLNCRVKNLGNKTMTLQVSWVRHRDVHLLTIGRYTYTNDQRFRAIHVAHSDDWMLQIKYPQHRDSGIYECQVSTTPHMSRLVHLNVVEPKTEILGAPDLFINRGSTINLTCVILQSPEPPAYIFWNHNDAIISYDSNRGGVSVVTEKGDSTTSFLLVQEAKPSDSGRYTCNPSNAQPKSITVHVLNEYPAAMQHGGQAKQPRLYSLLLCLCLLLY